MLTSTLKQIHFSVLFLSRMACVFLVALALYKSELIIDISKNQNIEILIKGIPF